MTQKTIVLGAEFDDDLRTDLVEVLRNIGATVTQAERAMAGSQELERTTAMLRGNVIVIEAETSLDGPRLVATTVGISQPGATRVARHPLACSCLFV
jgi:hypothetical protein